MPNDILDYCGVRLISSNGVANTHASEIAAQWNTGAALYDDGINRYVAWGNTEGTLNVFDLETSEVANTVHKVLNNYNSALTVKIETDAKGGAVPTEVMTFDANVYNTGAVSKKLRPLGDRYVLEGAIDFKIYQHNAL